MNEEKNKKIIHKKTLAIVNALQGAGMDNIFCFGNFNKDVVEDGTLAATVVVGSKKKLIMALAELIEMNPMVADIIISAFVLTALSGKSEKKSYSLDERLSMAKIKTEVGA